MDVTKANAQLLKVREQLTATYAEIQEAKDATFEETKKAKLLMVALQQETQVHRGLRALAEVDIAIFCGFSSRRFNGTISLYVSTGKCPDSTRGAAAVRVETKQEPPRS